MHSVSTKPNKQNPVFKKRQAYLEIISEIIILIKGLQNKIVITGNNWPLNMTGRVKLDLVYCKNIEEICTQNISKRI